MRTTDSKVAVIADEYFRKFKYALAPEHSGGLRTDRRLHLTATPPSTAATRPEIWGKCLHKVTLSEAIDSGAVLPFEIHGIFVDVSEEIKTAVDNVASAARQRRGASKVERDVAKILGNEQEAPGLCCRHQS